MPQFLRAFAASDLGGVSCSGIDFMAISANCRVESTNLLPNREQALYTWPAIHESPGAVKVSFGRSDNQEAKSLHEVTRRAGANPLIRSKKNFQRGAGGGLG